jgi:hypothetical protein
LVPHEEPQEVQSTFVLTHSQPTLLRLRSFYPITGRQSEVRYEKCQESEKTMRGFHFSRHFRLSGSV